MVRCTQNDCSEENFKVLIFDLKALKDCFVAIEDTHTSEKNDFMYHVDLIKGNLTDLFGMDSNPKIKGD